MKKIIVFALLCLFIASYTHAQITTNEPPISSKYEASLKAGLSIEKRLSKAISVPIPDMKVIHEEDSINDVYVDKLERVAVRIPITYNIKEHGEWMTLPDGGRVWQLTLSAKNAQSTDLTFKKFWLPQNGKFFVHNPITKEAIGAITSEYLFGTKEEPQVFSTGLIKGDIVTLEYYQPNSSDTLPEIELSALFYGYRTVSSLYDKLGFGSSEECQINVNCYEGDDWQKDKNAVARIYIKTNSFAGWCTGALVNNTNVDSAPLFLTANHCLCELDAEDDPSASEWIFYWAYELDSCNSITEPTIRSTVGATVKANGSSSDFALLRLTQDPRNLFGFTPYYLGWNRTENVTSSGVCIHHPRGDVKKLSTYASMPASTDYLQSYDYSGGSHWEVFWTETLNGRGTTEPGSSGSPLLDSQHRVIGQLHGGYASCSTPNQADWYGKFSKSWEGDSPTATRRLRDWLDPIGANLNTLDGQSAKGMKINRVGTNLYYIDELQSGYHITWHLQDSSSIYTNRLYAPLLKEYLCFFNYNVGENINEQLVASISINGISATPKTISTRQFFKYMGTYKQSMTISETDFFDKMTLYVAPLRLVTLTSSEFSNTYITHSGANLLQWNYDGNETIKLKFPNVSTPKTLIIKGERNKDIMSTPEVYTHFKFAIVADPNYSTTNSFLVSTNNNLMNITQNTVYGDILIEEWNVEVTNTVSGQKIYAATTNEKKQSIDTTNWPSGVYVVKIRVDDEIITHKFAKK